MPYRTVEKNPYYNDVKEIDCSKSFYFLFCTFKMVGYVLSVLSRVIRMTVLLNMKYSLMASIKCPLSYIVFLFLPFYWNTYAVS